MHDSEAAGVLTTRTPKHSVSSSQARDEKKFLMQMARDLGMDANEVVSAIYSPLRVSELAGRLNLGIAPGFAFDLTCKAWDFAASRRQEARRRLRIQRPMFPIGSPMCTAFSS